MELPALLVLPAPTLLAVFCAAAIGLVLAALLLRGSGASSKGSAAGAGRNAPSTKDSANGALAPQDTRDKCVILFGTQTGTAERFAKSLRAQLDGRYGGGTAFEVLDIEQYSAPQQLAGEKLVFLLMATYGDGDPTDSATEFWNWLSAEAEGGSVDQLQVRSWSGAGDAVGRWSGSIGGPRLCVSEAFFSRSIRSWGELSLPARAALAAPLAMP